MRGAVGENPSVATTALLGGTAGIIGQVIASPTDLVKVRMQADGRHVAEGKPARYKGLAHAFSTIVRTEGFVGLYRGVGPNAQRAFLVNMGELACYDKAKRALVDNNLLSDSVLAHGAASIASGLSATLLSCPADVVKTRMMNQASPNGSSIPAMAGGAQRSQGPAVGGSPLQSGMTSQASPGRPMAAGSAGLQALSLARGQYNEERVYRNSLDCLRKTVKGEGVLALWKGFWPTWVRLGPWQLIFWVSYEQLRRHTGLSTF